MRFVDTSRVRSRFDERVTAQDGTELSADVYRPAALGSYPVLVTLTPYDNNRSDYSQVPAPTTLPQVPSDRFKLYAEHGFIVVAADARGRGDSDGVFEPFVHEASDGADIVAWARALPESNGRVGVFGAGYAGFAALAAAGPGRADAVAAWSPFGSDGLPGTGGAARLDWLLWLHVVGGRRPQPADVPNWAEIFDSRPLNHMHEVLGRPDAAWPTWLEHLATDDSFWSALDLDEPLSSLRAPVLLVSGWWDIGLAPTLRHWAALQRSTSHESHRLVVGPWDAANTRRPGPLVGGFGWGPASVVDTNEMLIEWFTEQLVGNDEPEVDWFMQRLVESAPRAPAIRTFMTGRNRWIDADSYAHAAHPQRWHLASEGRANTRVGDGRLVQSTRPGNQVDAFIHDTANPVPWQPLSLGFSRRDAKLFTLDTSFVTTRDDALTYTTEPLPTPTVIVGRPVVHLWAETDAADADWIVLLEDVFPGDGRALCLTHGIVRAGSMSDFAPGIPVEYEITLGDVHHELQPNHQLRVVVVSSLFPLYALNLGGPSYTSDVADGLHHHVVHHGLDHPSRIELPVQPPVTRRAPRAPRKRWRGST